ncbi:MAG: glucose 1-dehydrogenase [Phycisphaerales bacterium]|nr:glucose 1-dehydrogenase [Phycisphaerales bacterium]
MSDARSKVALVTGASAGIGRETAIEMARDGYSIIVADILVDEGKDTVRRIESAGGKAVFVRTDVSVESDVRASVQAAVSEFGGLDAAVNNAGLEQSGCPVTEVTQELCDRILGINVRGVLMGMKHQIPAMRARGGGAIVNLSSIAGQLGFPGASVYVASKHAVIGLTRTAALECAPLGIRVNAVCPGAIQTDMIDRFAGHDSAAKSALIAHHPLGRIGTVSEVASAIRWLCSTGSAFVTGQCVTVDGGYTAQ